jgi:hypothetical protein
MRQARYFTLLAAITLMLSIRGFGDDLDLDPLDPVGFCPPPATVAGCTTSTGPGGAILIGSTSFGMMKNGNGGTPTDPWYLLVAIPNYSGSAPAITSGNFSKPAGAIVVDVGHFTSSKHDLYSFTGTTGDSSMNVGNLFGSAYAAWYGSVPNYFEVFKYTFTPAIANNTPYLFSVGGSGLPRGTVLAADGGTNCFTTPWTVAGLAVGPPPSVPDGGMTLTLLGGALFGLAALRSKFRV